MISDSQLQNKVATLEQQVLEAKKAALQKQLQTLNITNPTPPVERLVANPGKVKNSNFGSFYEHEAEESHLILLICKYRSMDIQYI